MDRGSVLLFFISLTMGILFIAPTADGQNETTRSPNETIWCFQCNSIIDPGCFDLEKKDIKTSPFYKSCDEQKPPLPHNHTWFCRKITQIIHDIGGKKRVIRKCGYIRSDQDCYRLASPSHVDKVCQCFEDGCNPAPPAALPAAVLTISAAALLTLFR